MLKTTWSQQVEVFPNLIAGKKLNGLNQVWQSDIFYLPIEGLDYYGITIEDIYSRKLLALHISESLVAKENEKALKQTIKMRKGQGLIGCIFHSDKGSQYISRVQKQLLEETGMVGSMCKIPQENTYAERVQGTIKHEYLYELKVTRQNYRRMACKIQRL